MSNHLLAALPEMISAGLQPYLEEIGFRQNEVLFGMQQTIGCIYFVQTGLVSSVLRLSDGKAAEVGLTGPEGFVGTPLILGGESTTTEALAQTDCTLLRLGAEPLRRSMNQMPEFRILLLRHILAVHEQLSQTTACNAHHPLDQRFARWLLMVSDRLSSAEVPMTQELLATMLGVLRPAVTMAARLFQQRGLIRYARGHIIITDRPALLATSCECYINLQADYTHYGRSVFR